MSNYSNRTDLQNPAKKIAASAAKGQTYGKAGQQLAAQKIVPMGTSQSSAPQQMAPQAKPGSLGALDRPTENPNEPGTYGSIVGPGPGPEAVPNMTQGVPAAGSKEDLLSQVKYIYSKFPNSAIFQLMLELEGIQL